MDLELPCPHCGSMLNAGQLKQHIQEQHADAGSSGGCAGTSGGAASGARPGPQKPAKTEGDKPKLNPPRKQLAAFAKLKEAVKEANKEVLAARAAGMPDASRAPPSAAAGRGK